MRPHNDMLIEQAEKPVKKGGLRAGPAPLLVFLLLALGIVAAAIGLLALLGWFLHLPLLASFKADYIPMAPSTAALFLLYGTAVCLRAREPLSRRAFRMSVAITGLGMMVALLLFALGSLNIHPAIEHPGLNTSATFHGMLIGHMSPVSASCFVFASLSFLASLSASKSPLWRSVLALGAAGLLLAACFVFLQAYLFGAPLLYGGTFIPPALNSILAFTVLGLALLAMASRSAGLLGGLPASGPGGAFIFVLILALVTAGIATASYRSYRNFERNNYSAAEQQLTAIADLKVDELVQYRKERLADANIFYRNSAFSEQVRRFLDQPADADARRLLLAWLIKIQTYDECARIYLLDVQGIERLAVPDQPEPLPGHLAKDSAACLQSGQIQFLDFHRDATNLPVQLDILVPIFDSSDTNRPLGVLGLRIDPKTFLYPLIKRWPVPSETAETPLVRREGNEAVFLNELRFQTNTALVRRFPLTSTNILAVKAVLGQTGIVEGVGYHGARVIGAVRSIPDSPWFMEARENTSEVFAPLRQQLWRLIFTLGVLFFGAAAGVGLIWRNHRARFYRREMETEAERARLGAIVESSNDAIIGKDLNGIITSWNHGAEKIFGYTTGGMVGTSITRLIPADRQEEETQILAKIARGESVSHFETVRQTKDGRLMDVSVTVSPIKDAAGKVIGASKVARDITPLKEREREILRLSRLYATLSQINQAIVWTPQRDEMLEKICRVLVEDGGFRMAWIGQPDAETQRVKTVAKWGDSMDYLSQAVIYADDRPEGRGPVGRAIREGKSYICNDFARDPNTLPWREPANRVGFRALAAFPIRQGGVVCGALSIYSDETGFFQDKEITLLEEVATDISFALDNLVREEVRQQMEMTLNASEVRYRRLFESAKDGILILDAETGTVVDVNPFLVELLGYSRAAFLGKKVWELGFIKDLFANQLNFTELQKKEYMRYENMALEGQDGQRHEVEFVSNVYQVNSHKVVQCNIRNITERKQAELALANERALLRNLVDHLPVAVYLKDNAGRKTLANPMDLRNFGVTSEAEVLGKTDFDFFPPEQAAAFHADDQLVLDGQPVFNREEKLTRPDGTVHWLLTSKVPLRDATGKVTGLAGFGLDITGRKQTEETIIRLAMAVEQSAETIFITNADGTIIYVNPAFEKSTGYPRAEALGQNPRMLKSGKQDAEFYRQMWDALGRWKIWRGHFINKRKDGTLYEEEATISPVQDATGKVVNYVAVKRDTTREMQLVAQLRESQKMEAFGQLAGGVAHDFNNILAVIQLQAGLLKAEPGLASKYLEYARDIELASQRGANLTRQLLLFSRKQAMQPQNLKLKDVVDNMAKMLQRTLGEQFELQFKFAPEPLFIHADPGMIDQILLNLTVNARDAMPKGGQITVETSAAEFDEVTAAQSPQARPGSFVCLSVSDTGSGIPPEILPRIFEPFFITKDVGKGTGLGLATVFGIVQQHQGWIDVYSEVGRGATFQVYLPRAAKTSDAEYFWSSRTSMQGGKETILLAEDEVALRAVVRTALSRLGYRVLEAASGEEALAVWKQHRDEIRLLLTDLVMPGGMSGKELAGQLLQQNPKLKVIYASGYSVEVAGKDLLLEEGVNFLAKPFQTSKLAQTIRKCLDRD